VVQSFGSALSGADVALFYYAGHGVQVRGTNYLVPVGANPVREADVDFQMLDANLVLRQMESAGTRLNIVILDACRNNPFGGRGLRSTERGLARMEAPQGTLISFATQPGNVALDGDGVNSPYSSALAQAIRRPGLDIFRTFNQVGVAVSNATNGAQQPWMSLSPIKGDFYFAAGSPAGAPLASPPPSVQGEAERAWAVTKDTTSIAVLEDFVRQFGGTPYGSLARARLQELKDSRVTASAPPVPSAPSPAPAPAATRQDNDGATSGSYRIRSDVSGGIHNMRTGPGTGHRLVVSIPAGSSGVALGECREPDDGRSTQRWCRASWKGHSGWISRSGIVGATLR
jgi:hypothetical protein